MRPTTPPTATVTPTELLREPSPWPGANLEDTCVRILVRKGIRFTPKVCLTLRDIAEPRFIERDSHTNDLRVWQPT